MSMFYNGPNPYNALNAAINLNIDAGLTEMSSDSDSANDAGDILDGLTNNWMNDTWVQDHALDYLKSQYYIDAEGQKVYKYFVVDGNDNPVHLNQAGVNAAIAYFMSEQGSASLASVSWLMSQVGLYAGSDTSSDLSQVQNIFSMVNSEMQEGTSPVDTLNKGMASQLEQDSSNMQPFTDMSSIAIQNGVESSVAGALQQQF